MNNNNYPPQQQYQQQQYQQQQQQPRPNEPQQPYNPYPQYPGVPVAVKPPMSRLQRDLDTYQRLFVIVKSLIDRNTVVTTQKYHDLIAQFEALIANGQVSNDSITQLAEQLYVLALQQDSQHQQIILDVYPENYRDAITTCYGYAFFRKHGTLRKPHVIKTSSTVQLHGGEDPRAEALFYTLFSKDNHPGLIRPVSADILPHRVVLITEYLQQGSLERKLSSDFFSTQKHIKKIFTHLAHTLDYLHNHMATSHLDLKPDNVLLDDDYNAHIFDLGMANTTEFSTFPHPPSAAHYSAPQSEHNFDYSRCVATTHRITRLLSAVRNSQDITFTSSESLVPRFTVPFSLVYNKISEILSNPAGVSIDLLLKLVNSLETIHNQTPQKATMPMSSSHRHAGNDDDRVALPLIDYFHHVVKELNQHIAVQQQYFSSNPHASDLELKRTRLAHLDLARTAIGDTHSAQPLALFPFPLIGIVAPFSTLTSHNTTPDGNTMKDFIPSEQSTSVQGRWDLSQFQNNHNSFHDNSHNNSHDNSHNNPHNNPHNGFQDNSMYPSLPDTTPFHSIQINSNLSDPVPSYHLVPRAHVPWHFVEQLDVPDTLSNLDFNPYSLFHKRTIYSPHEINADGSLKASVHGEEAKGTAYRSRRQTPVFDLTNIGSYRTLTQDLASTMAHGPFHHHKHDLFPAQSKSMSNLSPAMANASLATPTPAATSSTTITINLTQPPVTENPPPTLIQFLALFHFLSALVTSRLAATQAANANRSGPCLRPQPDLFLTLSQNAPPEIISLLTTDADQFGICGRSSAIGTVTYQAPENANRELYPFFSQTKSDIYSLGLILLRLMFNVLIYEKPLFDCQNFVLLWKRYQTAAKAHQAKAGHNPNGYINDGLSHRGVISAVLGVQYPLYSPSLMQLLEDLLCPEFTTRPSIKTVLKIMENVDWTLPDLSDVPNLSGVSPRQERLNAARDLEKQKLASAKKNFARQPAVLSPPTPHLRPTSGPRFDLGSVVEGNESDMADASHMPFHSKPPTFVDSAMADHSFTPPPNHNPHPQQGMVAQQLEYNTSMDTASTMMTSTMTGSPSTYSTNKSFDGGLNSQSSQPQQSHSNRVRQSVRYQSHRPM